MKRYESINFKVEKDLKKPTNYLPANDVKEIFGNLFQKRKTIIDNKDGNEILLNSNVPLEIFHYILDTNENQFFFFEKKLSKPSISCALQIKFSLLSFSLLSYSSFISNN